MVAVFLAATACATSRPLSFEPDADARLAYYAAQSEKHPDVYALQLGIAQAALDKARETHDPLWLAKADAAADASLKRMETPEGFKMKARIAAFRHRFDDSLSWIERAEPLTSEGVRDGGLVAQKVEALMGLSRFDEARALLPLEIDLSTDFHLAAAAGHYLAAMKKIDEAADAFAAAARIAAQQRAPQLAGWAEAMAAGVWLDAGDAAAARPHLNRSAIFDSRSRFYRMHVAELAALEGRPVEALRMFEALIEDAPDPELHRRAFLAARAAGDEPRASNHFDAAETMLTKVLATGETFTLAELAQLYVDGGMSAATAKEKAAAAASRTRQ